MSTSCEIAGNPSTMISPEICLCSSDVNELVAHQDRVQWIEWRADLLGLITPCEILEHKILWTYRTQDEGVLGEESLQGLIHALHKVALVDMHLVRDEALIRSLRHTLQQKVVVSYHGLYEGLEAFSTKLNQMRLFPRARYWKLALDFSKASLDDLVGCLSYLQSLPDCWQKKIIFIPLGMKWTALRLWSSCCLGGFLFSCCEEKSSLAPGQPTLEAALAFQRKVPAYSFYALLGSSVIQSPSHISHNVAFEELSEEARYLKIPLLDEEFSAFLKVAADLGVKGFSVTLPHKERALEKANSATALASEVGAANLLSLTQGGWHADNTDAKAFIEILDQLNVDASTRVLVLGAGGSAKAAFAVLARKGAAIDLVSRCGDRAQSAKKSLLKLHPNSKEVHAYTFENDSIWLHKSYDVIIQSTPLGMKKEDKYPFSFDQLCSRATLIELVNGPISEDSRSGKFYPTALSSYWQSNGRPVIHAREFFIRQASHQFQSWLGCDLDLGYHLLKAYFNS